MPYITQTERVLAIIGDPARVTMPLERIITEEIAEFRRSERYRIMQEAELAYRNRTNIQQKQNHYKDRSNSRIEHPLLKKLVDQKVNYSLSRPFSVSAENQAYADALAGIFDNSLRLKLKNFVRGAPKLGIGWMIPYIGEDKLLHWMNESALHVIPLWTDLEETDIAGFIRFYDQTVYVGTARRTITHAELWDVNGVRFFISDGGAFLADAERPRRAHTLINGKPHNWKQVPIVWVKYNEEQLPLHYYIKEIVESINWQASVTDDVLRDVAKFVWVLKNYGGEDLNQFVRELRESLAVQVDSDGGVDKIQPELNLAAVMAFLDKQRRDAFDYGAGVDTKDPELGNASGTAINFRYMDLDNDCQGLASEMQSAVERMKWFIDSYLKAAGQGDFEKDDFTVKFNMDIPANETDVIGNCATSASLLSQRTILANHPWVEDVDKEIEQIDAEREKVLKEAADYGFPGESGQPDDPDPGGEDA